MTDPPVERSRGEVELPGDDLVLETRREQGKDLFGASRQGLSLLLVEALVVEAERHRPAPEALEEHH